MAKRQETKDGRTCTKRPSKKRKKAWRTPSAVAGLLSGADRRRVQRAVSVSLRQMIVFLLAMLTLATMDMFRGLLDGWVAIAAQGSIATLYSVSIYRLLRDRK